MSSDYPFSSLLAVVILLLLSSQFNLWIQLCGGGKSASVIQMIPGAADGCPLSAAVSIEDTILERAFRLLHRLRLLHSLYVLDRITADQHHQHV
jgi:hypothetical protein